MEKPGRNDPCSCGSGKKFKKCCDLPKQKKILATNLTPSFGAEKMRSLFNSQVVPITPKSSIEEVVNPS